LVSESHTEQCRSVLNSPSLSIKNHCQAEALKANHKNQLLDERSVLAPSKTHPTKKLHAFAIKTIFKKNKSRQLLSPHPNTFDPSADTKQFSTNH